MNNAVYRSGYMNATIRLTAQRWRRQSEELATAPACRGAGNAALAGRLASSTEDSQLRRPGSDGGLMA